MKYKNVYGLTGSIACGKTTVAKFFEKYGIKVLDLDKVSRKVVTKGSKGLELIVNSFGKEYIDKDGELNRKKLGDLIFKNKEAKEKLEQILHPLIFEYEQNFVKKHNRIIVDAALMIETGSFRRYNKIIVVYVPENIQIERLMRRDNLTYNEALLRIRSQMSVEEKKKFADYLIDNSKSLEFTEKQVKNIVEELTK